MIGFVAGLVAIALVFWMLYQHGKFVLPRIVVGCTGKHTVDRFTIMICDFCSLDRLTIVAVLFLVVVPWILIAKPGATISYCGTSGFAQHKYHMDGHSFTVKTRP